MKGDEKLVLDQEAGKAHPGSSGTSLNSLLDESIRLYMGLDLCEREDGPLCLLSPFFNWIAFITKAKH